MKVRSAVIALTKQPEIPSTTPTQIDSGYILYTFLGTVVNAEITASRELALHRADFTGEAQQPRTKTYLGKISVLHDATHVVVEPSTVSVNNVSYSWSRNSTVALPGGRSGDRSAVSADAPVGSDVVDVLARRHVTVTLNSGAVLRILRHVASSSLHPEKVDFLGFYIEDETGLSEYTHGLIGKLSTRFATVSRYFEYGKILSKYLENTTSYAAEVLTKIIVS